MVDAILAKLKAFSRRGARPDRVSILLPFLIISLGLGALAWRSYNLSVKMERGVNTLAGQYAGYAAEITARRVDAGVATEMGRISDDWQQVERRTAEPTFETVSGWVRQHEWITLAVYIPDADPASSIYAAEASKGPKTPRLVREFYTSTGTLRYQYDPQRLLAKVQGSIGQMPLLKQQADVTVVHNARTDGLEKIDGGFAFNTKLAPPLDSYAMRAVVRTEYVGGRGWQNHRVMSLWVSLIALMLTSAGLYLAFRGLSKENETMKLRGALIANVSHELRTPLSMIRLGAETLKRGKLKDHERKDLEEQILREVLLLSHLVENVLDVARIRNSSSKALAFTPVSPNELIRNLVSTYESWIRSKGFAVALHLDDDVEEQMWDRDSVSRALLNLIDNAIKYSGDDRRIDVVLKQSEEHVVIEVKDHGIGIDAKDVAKIFEPYYRARFSDTSTRRGAGLGLTLVQQIVESHGGRVEVESVPGSGSTFRLLFPRGLSGAPEEVPAWRAREAF